MLVQCSHKLKAAGYLKIWKNREEKMHIQEIIFQLDNAPVHKSKIIGNIIEDNEWKLLEWPSYNPD